MGLRDKVLRGSAWNISGAVLGQAVHFGAFIILGRVLNPGQFGIMALALFFINFLRLFENLGFGKALIQKKDADTADFNTVFWSTVGLGFMLWLILYGAAGLIGMYTNTPAVVPVIKVLAVVYIIDTLKTVPLAILQKKMRFDIIMCITIGANVAYGVTAIPLALNGHGVYSLVYGFMVFSAVNCLGSFLFCGWHPRFQIEWSSNRSILTFGLHLTGASFLNYISNNVERFFLGRNLGAVNLGIYHFAARIINMPRQTISQNIAKVVFPAFAQRQDNAPKLLDGYLGLLRILSYISLPAAAVAIILADLWIPMVFGDTWAVAVTPFRILGISGTLATIGSPLGNAYLAKGKSYISIRINLAMVIIALTIYPLTSGIGLLAVCCGAVLFRVVNFSLNVFYSAREVQAGLYRQLRAVSLPVLCALTVALVTGGVRWGASTLKVPQTGVVLASAIMGAASGLLLLRLTDPELLYDILGAFRKKVHLT